MSAQGRQQHHHPSSKLHAWGTPPYAPFMPGMHSRLIEGGTVPGRVPLCPVTQADTSVPVRAPWGLGACPAIRARGLLAEGGPALAAGTPPLEKQVDKGLGAVQSWGSPPCPLSLWLLLLPLLLCGQREGGVGAER